MSSRDEYSVDAYALHEGRDGFRDVAEGLDREGTNLASKGLYGDHIAANSSPLDKMFEDKVLRGTQRAARGVGDVRELAEEASENLLRVGLVAERTNADATSEATSDAPKGRPGSPRVG